MELHQVPMTDDAICIADFQTYSEEIPIDDLDEVEDIPEAQRDNIQ